MKKYRIVLLLFVFFMVRVQAQMSNEVTEQKKTQIEYLVEQIVALRSYAEAAAKGYGVVRKGLSTIKHIKKSDLALHTDHFTSLKRVNPKIRLYWKVGATLALQIQVLQQWEKQRTAMQSSGTAVAREIKYYSAVASNLLEGCRPLMEDLKAVITDNSFLMTDDERLIHIEKLHQAMLERAIFLQDFCSVVTALDIQQKHEKADLNTIRSMNSFY